MNSWVFQAKPSNFDLLGYISKCNPIYWSVGHINPRQLPALHDEVFIWKAYGEPKDFAGVVAHGVVVEPPIEKQNVQFPQFLGENFWRGSASEKSSVKVGVGLDEIRPSLNKGALYRESLKMDALLSQSQIVKAPHGTVFLLKPQQAARLRELWLKAKAMQPTKLQPGFMDYINSLDITIKSMANYRQYVRWIEKYGTGVLDAVTLQNPAKVAAFIENLAERYDADSKEIRRLQFDARRGDTKTVLHHYLNFLQSLDDAVEEIEQELESAGQFDNSNEQDAKEKVLRSIVLRRGQPKFRENLLRAYAGKCAITGTSVADILEAAHIAPYNGPSTNHITNGLLLRSDVHALFDLRLLSIDPNDLRIYCSKQIRREPMYAELNGKPLCVPEKALEKPNLDALRIHFEKRIL